MHLTHTYEMELMKKQKKKETVTTNLSDRLIYGLKLTECNKIVSLPALGNTKISTMK